MITFVLLSPTFGMHQYTADLANRVEGCRLQVEGSPVRVVTTANAPRDRYGAGIELATPLTSRGTGFSREGLDARAYRAVRSSIFNLQPATRNPQPPTVHFTGVHAWNVPLAYALRRQGVRVIHTLHDLDPHAGVRHAGLIRLWNRLIIGSGAHILVHGRCYRERLIARGLLPGRVTYAPLLHGFWGCDVPPEVFEAGPRGAAAPSAARHVLFFGRVERYKGVDTLLEAWARLVADRGDAGGWALVIAGVVSDAAVAARGLPPRAELRDRRIGDAEAIELFRSAAVLVLPYRDATQSALVAAAYAFGVPVIVSRSGALPEYVAPPGAGACPTGWVVEPGDPAGLAAALAAALADPERLAAMGAAGRAWLASRRAEEERVLGRMYCEAIEGYKVQVAGCRWAV